VIRKVLENARTDEESRGRAPEPTPQDKNPVYVKGVRRALQIDADDEEFFGRA
jgi:hypothetical protein